MKYTLFYLKIILFVILLLIMLAGFISGGICVLVGLFNALANKELIYLVAVPVGLFCGLIGFVALDTIEHIDSKWSWKA